MGNSYRFSFPGFIVRNSGQVIIAGSIASTVTTILVLLINTIILFLFTGNASHGLVKQWPDVLDFTS
jgi:hypothetical protein